MTSAPTLPSTVRLLETIRSTDATSADARWSGSLPQATRMITTPSMFRLPLQTSRLPLRTSRRRRSPWMTLTLSLTSLSLAAVGISCLILEGTRYELDIGAPDPPGPAGPTPTGTADSFETASRAPVTTPPAVLGAPTTTPSPSTTTAPTPTDPPTPVAATPDGGGLKPSARVTFTRPVAVTGSPASPVHRSGRPTTTASAPGTPGTATCGYTYAINTQWDGGLVATITLTNTGTQALTNWDGGFRLSSVATITRSWGAIMRQTGDWVVLTPPPDYNTVIEPGATITIGFQASTVAPVRELSGFSMAGQACVPQASR